jgi:hypothetical protein
MSKSGGRKHKWERNGEWATCINCGLKVETKRIRRGGLPTCDEVLSSKAQPSLTDEKTGERAQVPSSEIQPSLSDENAGNFFQEYLVSYRKGCELFGVWWKLFTFSMITFSVVFFLVAIILVLLYLV